MLVWGITLTVGIIVVFCFRQMDLGRVIAFSIQFALLVILALPVILVIWKWHRSGSYKKFGMVVLAVSFYALTMYVIFFLPISGQYRGSPKTRSINTAFVIAIATADYIIETGNYPPLNSHLSKILMGQNRLNIPFIEAGSKDPVGTLINKEGDFIDAYGHPYSVEIKDNEIIVKNSDGEVLATQKIDER